MTRNGDPNRPAERRTSFLGRGVNASAAGRMPRARNSFRASALNETIRPMTRGRRAGQKNRSYPPRPLKEALGVAEALADEASGMTVSRLTLAELLDSTPTSREFKELVASSRFYGLTTGGINAEEFGLTQLGEQATGEDEKQPAAALKAAVMNVPQEQEAARPAHEDPRAVRDPLQGRGGRAEQGSPDPRQGEGNNGGVRRSHPHLLGR